MRLCLKYGFLLLYVINSCFVFSQEDGGIKLRNNRKNAWVKTRIGLSPIIGLYKANKNHTSNTKQKTAGAISVKEEIRLDKKNRCFLMAGAEYIYHGVTFNSYYFQKDSIQFYNKSMAAQYNLVIHELDIPLQLKYSFKKETNSVFSGYIFGGYCSRWLLKNNLTVNNNGEQVFNDKTNLQFKIPLFTKTNNSFLSGGLGIQRNHLLNNNAVFAEIQFRYGLSPLSLQEDFMPSNLTISNHFIFLTIGFKI